jgi:hypothetical protein
MDRTTTTEYVVELRAHRRRPRWYTKGSSLGDEFLSDGQTITRASEVPLGTRATVTVTMKFHAPKETK